MIGQTELLNDVNKMLDNNKLPRFIILAGLPGSGKKLMAKYIADKLGADMIQYSCGVDDMRAMIGQANKITSTKVFLIPDADNMSPAARNCILKVTEEPPQDAHFIMTVSDANNVLETIRSRGTVLYMNRYTPYEIGEYVKTCTDIKDPIKIDIITSVCEVPGDVDLLETYNPVEFESFVTKVVDNIDDVSVANMFKISNSIKLKDTSDGYDIRLFLRMFVSVCADRLRQDVVKYGKWVVCTCKILQELQITGANKSMLIDDWLLRLQEI